LFIKGPGGGRQKRVARKRKRSEMDTIQATLNPEQVSREPDGIPKETETSIETAENLQGSSIHVNAESSSKVNA
jgi:hypothetical protein